MKRWCLFGATLAVFLIASSTRAVIIPIDVFDFDFGNATTGTHIDPIINLGDTIEWRWMSGFHNARSVIGSPEVFDSGHHSPPFTFQHTYTNLGTFWYYCDLHGGDNGNGTASGMSGRVTVVPEPASLVGLGIAALGVLRLRRRTARA